MLRRAHSSSGYLLLCFGMATWSGACGEPTALAPDESAQPAKGATAPTVTAASPASSGRPATLDVRVLGRGFDRGSTVAFAFSGVTDPRLKVNSTRFVKSSELVANLTISGDAPLVQYDVVVTLSTGKKGVGSKLFAVVSIVDLGLVGNGDARDVNSTGIVVGDYEPPGTTLGCRRPLSGPRQPVGRISQERRLDAALPCPSTTVA